MFDNILVPLDFSGDSERALVAAKDLARLTGGCLTICTVVTPLGPADQEDIARLEELALQRADLYLHKKEDEARGEGLEEIRRLARRGDPAESILEEARANGVDLIVMASHGIGRAYKYPLGSVALRVLMAAPCPVLTIRTSLAPEGGSA